VALDGKIIAREPNGDVIDMQVPGWQVWRARIPHTMMTLDIYILIDVNIITYIYVIHIYRCKYIYIYIRIKMYVSMCVVC